MVSLATDRLGMSALSGDAAVAEALQNHTVTATTDVMSAKTVVTRTPLLNVGDVDEKRQEILTYFHSTYSLYESIFECLNGDEAYYRRANPLRHPLIFYYGHTAVFFINKLNVSTFLHERIDPRLESILAIGVDEMSWDDLNEKHYDWPRVETVKAYRDKTREKVDHFIRTVDFSLPIGWDSPMWIILMGIEHERIHLETTSVLIRELPLRFVKAHPFWGRRCTETGAAPENTLLPVESGTVVLGKTKEDALYGWDNEYGHQSHDVKAFAASKYLVSNEEYLVFVAEGGYQDRTYWTEEGWQWRIFRQAEHPVFWIKQGETYRYRSLLAVIDMPWDWPVEVNYLEAKAFCNWKARVTGKDIRLPTEAEWHRLREGIATDQPYWDKAPGNINLEGDLSPCPITRHSSDGNFFDVIGNVWQWTETPVDGFDGFEVHPAYDDFSIPTFDGKHNLFKGGCWISTGNYAIKNSRYAFRRHFFQHAGLRYVEAEPITELTSKPCERDVSICHAIEAQYGTEKLEVRSFPVVCAQASLALMVGRNQQRALDLGCSTGRAAFELAQTFKQVDALDFSARVIQIPAHLQSTGEQRYVVVDEGELLLYKTLKLSNFSGYEAVKDKITFMQADACNLPEKFAGYDLVLAGNLLEHLYDPKRFLSMIKPRIRSGGLLIIASTYYWQESITPRANWLGGFKAETGERYTTRDAIAERLAPEFVLLGKPRDIPCVERDTARAFRYGISEMTVWEKR